MQIFRPVRMAKAPPSVRCNWPSVALRPAGADTSAGTAAISNSVPSRSRNRATLEGSSISSLTTPNYRFVPCQAYRPRDQGSIPGGIRALNCQADAALAGDASAGAGEAGEKQEEGVHQADHYGACHNQAERADGKPNEHRDTILLHHG